MKSSEDVYQTILRLEGYAQLALWVRAIKYLGIYRHSALPELVARRDIPRARCVGEWPIAEPLRIHAQRLPSAIVCSAPPHSVFRLPFLRCKFHLLSTTSTAPAQACVLLLLAELYANFCMMTQRPNRELASKARSNLLFYCNIWSLCSFCSALYAGVADSGVHRRGFGGFAPSSMPFTLSYDALLGGE